MQQSTVSSLARNTVLWRIVAIIAIVAVLAFMIAQAAQAAPSQAESPAIGAGENRLLQTLLNGVIFGLLLALASVGLSLIYGTTGLSNFAHGEQVTFGAASAFVAVSAGAPLWAAIIIAVFAGAASGWVQDVLLWKQLRKRNVPHMQQMIVSIGLALVLINMMQIWIGPDRLRLSTESPVKKHFGPFALTPQTAMSMLICVIALGAVAYFLMRTRLGRATRAVSDNPALAAATGISVNRVIRVVWMMAAGLAALAGPLLALYGDTLDFTLGSRILLLMFAAVTLGGLGHPFGAAIGALIIGIVAELATVYAPTPDLKYAAVMAILILTLLVRPQGILGRKERVG